MNLLSFSKTRFFFLAVVVIVFLGSISSALFYHRQYQISLKNQKALTEIEGIVRKVSQLMELPEGETPTLATVSDKTLLQNQSFFQNAENGDRILVYSQAKRAILYRPSSNKIIDVSPIYPATESADVKLANQTPVVNKARVALYNGTEINGLAKETEAVLKANSQLGSMIEIVARKDAINDYSQTVVVDLKGNQKVISEKIAQILSGRVGSLPEGEKVLEVDLVVFLGRQN